MSNNVVKKWMLQRITAVILLPLLIWFLSIFVGLVQKDYQVVIAFFKNDINFVLSVILLTLVFLHMKIGMGEIFEDYIQNSKYKSVANFIISVFATVLPLATVVSLILIKFN
ncbi:MAG: succinate dehydrogenase, hydrophobic membrane anchor protein [Pelagibacteraceae bacterium]|jgi:succinate dehydrogenase / fumarate reductase membrane anchor subunit